MTSPNSPRDLGHAFKRVRYIFHAEFFALLATHQPSAAPLSKAFAKIWARCKRWASNADLDAHHPTLNGVSPKALLEHYLSWSRDDQVAMLIAFGEVITAEASGDAQRGRHKLSARLRETIPLLDDLIDAF